MDAIILSNRSTDEINRMFEELGAGTRSAGSIAARRQYLKKQGEKVDYSTMDLSRRLSVLSNRRTMLRQEIADTRAELAAKERALAQLNENMRKVADEVNAQASEDSGGGGSS
jgi:chromosome segregation ATPase